MILLSDNKYLKKNQKKTKQTHTFKQHSDLLNKVGDSIFPVSEIESFMCDYGHIYNGIVVIECTSKDKKERKKAKRGGGFFYVAKINKN